MRFVSICAALLLLIALGSCSGGSVQGSTNRDSSKVFTLSDAQIAALDAAPAPDWHSDKAKPGDVLSQVPYILADQASTTTGAKGVSTYGKGGSNKCGACKSSCGKCNHKSSCKCHGDCQKCHSCKSSCGKCNHKDTCNCHGKCKQKCSSCKDNCGKCSHDGNCGCHGKCKEKCNKCTSGCSKCSHDGNCGCNSKCKQPCKHCKSNCTKCKHNGNCTCNKCECPPCPCDVQCKSMTCTGVKSYTKDCATGTADATYKVHLTFTDCPNVTNEAVGHEVVFTRNGIDVGTATTDMNGDAWITDMGLVPGTYNITAKSACCFVCFDVCVKDKDCCQVECLNATNTGGASFQADCATHCADVTYSVHITYNDCPNIDNEALGHEVVFNRNGAEVGRATTDINGDASFTESCVDLGNYNILVTSEDCNVEFPINVYEDCCVEECSDLINSTPRFFKAECDEGYSDVTYNFHTEWSLCPGKDFNKAGYEITIVRNGVEVGKAVTDANGDATFEEDDVDLGTYHVVATLDEHCVSEFDITAYDDCHYHACLTGYGKIPGINGDPFMVFAYETHVDSGMLEEIQRMSLTDGDISFTDVPTTWNIDLGLEAYFGNDNIMFHTIDNGKSPNVDFVEVWVFDRGYHNSGIVQKGQIRASWGLHPGTGPIW